MPKNLGVINDNLDTPTKKYADEHGPVQDVQVAGTSIMNDGIANIPGAGPNTAGVVRIGQDYGIGLLTSTGTRIIISKATDALIKEGTQTYKPIVSSNQHQATFYGLAKAAGDTSQSASSNAVGTYTQEAKKKIRTMLGAQSNEWELIADVTVGETSAQVNITTDLNGQEFALSKALVRVWLQPSTTGANDYISSSVLVKATNDVNTTSSCPTERYSANGAATFLEFVCDIMCNVSYNTGRKASVPGSTSSVDAISSASNNMKYIRGFRLSQYSGTSSLIPKDTVIKIYGIRFDE